MTKTHYEINQLMGDRTWSRVLDYSEFYSDVCNLRFETEAEAFAYIKKNYKHTNARAVRVTVEEVILDPEGTAFCWACGTNHTEEDVCVPRSD